MSAQPNPFHQAAADSQKAILTFLPSLAPKPPVPPPPQPPKISPALQEGLRAASLVRHVEQMSARVARGMPAEEPPPPSPQETFGVELDPVHMRALQIAVAAHPETQRAALLHEAHDMLAKWVMANNGRVVVDGKMQIANNPGAAESLAAKIINEAVDQHDGRVQQSKEALRSTGEDDGSAPSTDRGRSGIRPVPTPQSGSVDQGTALSVPPPLPVGATDPATQRPITQSSPDLDAAQAEATSAAPELKDTLGQVEDSVPGAEVDGVRESKDPERAQQKVEADGKPVETQTDLLAGRIAVDSPEAKDAAVQQLKDSVPVIDEEDHFKDGDPDYGFRSHTLQVGLGHGKTSAEVQVVPKEIAEADDDTHDTYEAGREAEATGDDKTAHAAMDKNKSAHDAAMEKFEKRNADRPARIRKALEDAGFTVRGNPVKIGGHSFVPVVDEDDD